MLIPTRGTLCTHQYKSGYPPLLPHTNQIFNAFYVICLLSTCNYMTYHLFAYQRSSIYHRQRVGCSI